MLNLGTFKAKKTRYEAVSDDCKLSIFTLTGSVFTIWKGLNNERLCAGFARFKRI